MENLITGIKVVLMTALPVVMTTVLKVLQINWKPFRECKTSTKNIAVGILFGLCAVYGTEFGVNTGLAVVNTRDAAVICAGLFFGGPAAGIAAVIGSVERFLAPLWGVGSYTKWACSVATFLSGGMTALLRYFFFEKKRPKWHQALAVGVFAEVFHLLLVFVTHMDDIHTAFSVVKACSAYMLLMNGVAVMLSAVSVTYLEGKTIFSDDRKEINTQFNMGLFIAMVAGFAVSIAFTFVMEHKLYLADTETVLNLNLTDVEDEITYASDEALLDKTRRIVAYLNVHYNGEVSVLAEAAELYGVSEVNVVDWEGIIENSTNPRYVGFDMSSGEQSREFNILLEGVQPDYVQAYMENTYEASSMKYAACALRGGYIQTGYDAEMFQENIASQVSGATRFRHIYQTGFVLIADRTKTVVSDRNNLEGMTLSELGCDVSAGYPENTMFRAEINGVDSFFMYRMREGYTILACVPVAEAKTSGELSMYLIFFMEMAVFALMFISLFYLIKSLVLKNLDSVNEGLRQITDGNLETVLNIDKNKEFQALSEGINTTVTRLKALIEEANARIDAELEFAKAIQSSSVPTVFPKYPDGEIFALMDTAKEVGGDFYDFFFVPPKSLYILVADVSGKGIPAALFMMRAKTLIRNLTKQLQTDDIGKIFTLANEALCESNDAGMFVTCWMACIDIKTGHVTFANGGHNKPVIIRAGQKPQFIEEKVGFVLAGMEGVVYKTQEFDMDKGDSIYLYTDGITEATNIDQQLFGDQRLLEVVSTASDDPEDICKKVKVAADEFTGSAPQFDDMTELAFTRR